MLTRPRSTETAAHILAQAALAEQAVAQLELLLSSPSSVSVNTLRLDPLYDPIRDSIPFRALLDRSAGSFGDGPSAPDRQTRS